MATDPQVVFPEEFRIALRALVNVNHSIYHKLPPQGIYFEALVEEAFSKIKKPFAVIESGIRNQPTHDLIVEKSKLSLKTQTGAGTHPTKICITKRCTTEREPWTAKFLAARVVEHLARYDHILMLRAVWQAPGIHYQLLDIPVETLRLIGSARLVAVGGERGAKV